MVYKIRAGFQTKGDPQVIGDRLENLTEKFGGNLTAEQVLADAKKASSPLHQEFEWDDSAAAQSYRLTQARYLIRSIEVVHVPYKEQPTKTVSVRAFQNVVVDDEKVYATTERVMADEDLRTQLLADAKRALQTWKNKYANLKELAAVYAAIDEVQ
jgi:hypothetical protein